MKKQFLLLAILSVFALWGNAQIYISSITPNTALTGQSLNVTIMGSGTNFTAATNTYLTNGVNWVYPSNWSPLNATTIVATYTIPPNVQTGLYDVKVGMSTGAPLVLLQGFGISTGLPPGNYGTVVGMAYVDANSNCTYNVGEQVLANRWISIQPGNNGTMTDANGYYSIPLPYGNYSFSFVPGLPYAPTCPNTGTATVNVATTGTIGGPSFGSSVTSFTDAAAGLSSIPLRTGFTSTVVVLATNAGNQTLGSGTVRFRKPSFAIFQAFNPAPTSVNGDTVTWNYSSIANSMSFTPNVTIQVPSIVLMNTPYTMESWVYPGPSDIITSNNHFVKSDVVRASCDPNDKQVWTQSGNNANGDVMLGDSMLTYLVRFQNVGNDTAFNITIRDTLDVADINLSSFQILGASHYYRVVGNQYGRLEVAFPNILLPDSSTNQAASNGWLLYRLKRRSNATLGTTISNSASIYFDFNAPVKTNTTVTRYCDALNAAATTSINGYTAQFTNQTTGTVTSWYWDFGDGTTSTLANPNHTYTGGSNYTACLIATGICRSDTVCIPVQLCTTAPTSSFIPTSNGLQVTFNNSFLNAVSCIWDFGDGNTSTAPNPVNTYAQSGTYTVCVTTTSSCGITDQGCVTITVCGTPSAAWSSNSSGGGLLNFTNLSADATSWVWDFGDGGTSSAQQPSHQYASDGTYNICLIATNSCRSDTSCTQVQVCGVPVNASYNSSATGLTATFTDGSSNVQSWLWDFGDGQSSTQQHPTHTYAMVGNYTVCLTVTSACGTTAQTCSPVTACTAPTTAWTSTPPSAGTVQFTDASQYATAWQWDFGNGAFSTAQNPSHTYTVNGSYMVCLISSNLCGQDTSCTELRICPATLQAGYSAQSNQYTYNFTDQSSGSAVSYHWDFGDGNTASTASPSHTYTSNGTYQVCQTVYNLCGDSSLQCSTLVVNVVGVTTPNSVAGLEVYPNPMGTEAKIMLSHTDIAGDFLLEVWDASGRKVAVLEGRVGESLTLYRGGIASGMYTLRAVHEGIPLGTKRIIMQ